MGDKTTSMEQAAEVSATARFMGDYLTSLASGKKRLEAFDSAVHVNDKVVMPPALKTVFDSFNDKSKDDVLLAFGRAVDSFKKRHGGELPSASLVASAFCDAANIVKSSKNNFSAYDSLTYGHSESLSIVPTLAIVVMSMRIAQSIPSLAVLPNPKGSNEVPLVYVRNQVNKKFGALDANDWVDGSKATLQYFDNNWEFKMVPTGTANQFQVVSHVAYADADQLTVDTSSTLAPFLGGRVRILVNGVEVANDAYTGHKTKSGINNLNALGTPVTINGTTIVWGGGTASLDDHTITANFGAALPVDAVVTANVIFDYERKNPSTDTYLLAPPGLDADVKKYSIFAYPIRAQVALTIDAVTQMMNELGVDANGSAVAVIVAKFYLEQNIRLLKGAKRRALNRTGGPVVSDLSRGSDLTEGFNNTSDIVKEVMPKISAAKMRINERTNNGPIGFDIYVGKKGALLCDNLPQDSNFTRTNAVVGATDAIVRIGSFNDETNVYFVPTGSGVITESETTTQMLVIARNSEAAKSIFVGHTAVPIVSLAVTKEAFEKGVGIYGRNAAEQNPNPRFADQCEVVNIINLPESLAG